MADSWWDELLARLFTPPENTIGYKGFTEQSAKTVGALNKPLLKPLNDEIARQKAEALKQANPTPAPATAPKNPNARESEDAQSVAKDAAETSGSMLYGIVPKGKVYMGSSRVQRGPNLVNSPQLEELSEVIAQVNDWTPKKIAKFNDLAVAAGYLKYPTQNLDEIEKIWTEVSVRSAKMWERQIGVTPWQLLSRYAKSGDAPGSGANGGPITSTSVSKSVDISSPRDANALVDAALQQRLGRSPTEEEKKDFLAALNSAEKKEPKVSKTTTTTTGSGTPNVSSTSSTSSSGGVNTANFAREWSMSHNKDEAGSYQALSYYMPLLFQALEAPV